MQVDAWKSGTGAALIQDRNPVAYASNLLALSQQRYAIIE